MEITKKLIIGSILLIIGCLALGDMAAQIFLGLPPPTILGEYEIFVPFAAVIGIIILQAEFREQGIGGF